MFAGQKNDAGEGEDDSADDEKFGKGDGSPPAYNGEAGFEDKEEESKITG